MNYEISARKQNATALLSSNLFEKFKTFQVIQPKKPSFTATETGFRKQNSCKLIYILYAFNRNTVESDLINNQSSPQ